MIKSSIYESEWSFEGLSQREAELRLKKYGFNELEKTQKTTAISMLLNQFKDFTVIILMIATSISFLLGEIVDAIAITSIIVINAILGFIQEYRTEKSLEALSKLSSPHAIVIRDGECKDILAKEVVTGDILSLEAGNIVVADCILLESSGIQVNESILTGESIPVEKTPFASYKAFIPQNARNENKLYAGTTLISGKGKAIVIKTGMKTEMGRIAQMLGNVKEDATPLQKRLDKISKQLVMICLGVCAVIVVVGIYRGEALLNMFMSGMSLAVAAIPEGLPAIVTVSLAIGVQRILKCNALIRKLPAIETLGCVNVICSDKTGTLTENKMTVKKVYVDNTIIDLTGTGYEMSGKFLVNNRSIKVQENIALEKLLTIGALCNNAIVDGEKITGDPTEIAILIASQKANIDKNMIISYSRIAEIPFDSDRKRMSIVCRDKSGNTYVFVKGAPDIIVDLCTLKLEGKEIEIFGSIQKNKVMEVNDKMADEALRVLAFAYKKLDFIPRNLKSEELEKNLIFVGMEGMLDPPRIEAIDAVKSCYKAGIKPVMITGDHKITAIAIARELNMKIDDKKIMIGDEIERITDNELIKIAPEVSVFARVTPKHKLRIVQAFKRRRYIVAMTGDGVNDAPALKEANIGIAMGKSGTDVAKEASSMILLDDNFATIVAAIKEGRIIYDNIRKSIRYLLACNLSEILLMAISILFVMPIPLLPIQILWINLVTDGLPALALSIDPAEEDIMGNPPRKSDESIFSRGLGRQIFLSGLVMSVSAIMAFTLTLYLTRGDIAMARTVTFATIIVAELLYAFESRSEHKNVLETSLFANPYLVLAVLSSFLLMLVVLYNPFLCKIFRVTHLGLKEWILVIIFSGIEFVINCFTSTAI